MVSKVLLFITIFYFAGIRLGSNGAKICYQCDELHPSSRWKFWGEKITKCSTVPFEKYATKTSKAFGSDVLTCYTKFNDQGKVIKRGAYGFGEAFDKNFKCRDRYHLCCRTSSCNKHSISPCPPTPGITQKEEVKACYQCKGADNCRPENLAGAEIRTSAVLGAKNLYCYTKFDPKTGRAIARGGFGFGEALDKYLKCDAKHYLCCYENMCNNHTVGFCVKPQHHDQHDQHHQHDQHKQHDQHDQHQQHDQQQQEMLL